MCLGKGNSFLCPHGQQGCLSHISKESGLSEYHWSSGLLNLRMLEAKQWNKEHSSLCPGMASWKEPGQGDKRML